jgi:uncharacterized membrane-anchored protein YitT (DUF2179 family)
MNIIIFIVAGILFGWDRAMYSLMAYFITFKVIGNHIKQIPVSPEQLSPDLISK